MSAHRAALALRAAGGVGRHPPRVLLGTCRKGSAEAPLQAPLVSEVGRLGRLSSTPGGPVIDPGQSSPRQLRLQHFFFAMFARAHLSSVEIPASELKIGSELQRGGMGAVLTGKWLGISVAVKTVTDVSKQEALLREAELLASMRHPCICQFYGASRIDGTFGCASSNQGM